MIWLVIGLALAVLWIIHGWRDSWFFDTVVGHVLADIAKIICGISAGCILLLISSGIIYATKPDYTETKSTQAIYALSDNVGMSGSFFIGSGYVNSELSYFYVIETENGKHIESVKRENAYVKYADAHTVTVVHYEFANKALHWFAFSTKGDDYIFTVPEGTITSSYQIDLN